MVDTRHVYIVYHAYTCDKRLSQAGFFFFVSFVIFTTYDRVAICKLIRCIDNKNRHWFNMFVFLTMLYMLIFQPLSQVDRQ